jgi:hypothetical protein
VGVGAHPVAREEDEFWAVGSIGLENSSLEIADESASVRVGGLPKGDWSGVEDQVVGAGTGGVGRCGGGGVWESLFVKIEVGDDLFGKVWVLDFFPKLGIVCGKELGVGHL